MKTRRNITVAFLSGALVTAAAAIAQAQQSGRITLELNTLETVDDACRISFLIRNGHATDIDQAVFEAVLFDTEGQVERLTLFDFGALPASRPRVRQFVVPALACASLGRLMINGADTCTGDGLPEHACTEGLDVSSRTDAELLG